MLAYEPDAPQHVILPFLRAAHFTCCS